MQGTLPRVVSSIFGTAVVRWVYWSSPVGSAVALWVSRWVSCGFSVAPTFSSSSSSCPHGRPTVLRERSGSCLARKLSIKSLFFNSENVQGRTYLQGLRRNYFSVDTPHAFFEPLSDPSERLSSEETPTNTNMESALNFSRRLYDTMNEKRTSMLTSPTEICDDVQMLLSISRGSAHVERGNARGTVACCHAPRSGRQCLFHYPPICSVQLSNLHSSASPRLSFLLTTLFTSFPYQACLVAHGHARRAQVLANDPRIEIVHIRYCTLTHSIFFCGTSLTSLSLYTFANTCIKLNGFKSMSLTAAACVVPHRRPKRRSQSERENDDTFSEEQQANAS